MKPALPAAILLVVGVQAFAHRLDEYLEATILSVGKNRVQAQMTLTPGVSVFPTLITEIDTNGDGVISALEQRAYAGRVLRDLSLKLDGHPLTPELLSVEFPSVDEMREGRGEARMEFEASLPPGGPDRKLTFENRHLSRIAAYQVNCLVPRDPDVRIVAQSRNYSQSFYALEFAQAGVRSGALGFAWLSGAGKPLGTIALVLGGWLALLWRRAGGLKSAGTAASPGRPDARY